MAEQEIRLVGAVVADRGRRTESSITIRGQKIVEISPVDQSRPVVPPVDADGLLVAPGLIDLQINGGHGIDLASKPEQLWALADLLPANGVTAFQPTIVSSPAEVYRRATTALANRPADHHGAEPLGLHFEGPMLNPERAGAHSGEHLRPPDRRLIDRWSRADGVTMVTVAPELSGAIEIIEQLVSQGVVVSAGHSMATAKEAQAGVEAGVTMVTHLFNGMEPIHHRAPRLAGLALADDRLVTGIIADGIHVDPVMVSAALAAKGTAGLVLVSDAVAAQGLAPGNHRLGDRTVTADHTSVRLADGTLAGSSLTLDEAVRNLVTFSGCSFEEAISTATSTAAAVLDRQDRGRISVGAIADLALFDDDRQVAMTLCRGRVVYVADHHRCRIPSQLLPIS